MALNPHDKTNFNTLISAANAGCLALMEVQRVADEKPVAALCAVGWDGDEYTFTPFATMVEGNPFELFNPPDPDNPAGFFRPD